MVLFGLFLLKFKRKFSLFTYCLYFSLITESLNCNVCDSVCLVSSCVIWDFVHQYSVHGFLITHLPATVHLYSGWLMSDWCDGDKLWVCWSDWEPGAPTAGSVSVGGRRLSHQPVCWTLYYLTNQSDGHFIISPANRLEAILSHKPFCWTIYYLTSLSVEHYFIWSACLLETILSHHPGCRTLYYLTRQSVGHYIILLGNLLDTISYH